MSAHLALWASVVISGLAQIVLKLAVSGPLGQASARSFGWWKRLLGSGWIWLYAMCFTLATALWLVALSRLNISYAFPLLSGSYILVALLARVLLKEGVSGRRWLAIGLISAGVVIIAWG